MGKAQEKQDDMIEVCERRDRQWLDEVKKEYGGMTLLKNTTKEKVFEVIPYNLPIGTQYTPKIYLTYIPFSWFITMECHFNKKAAYRVESGVGIPATLMKMMLELLELDHTTYEFKKRCEEMRLQLVLDPKKWWQVWG